jgi:SAM-dependent methyltransferase
MNKSKEYTNQWTNEKFNDREAKIYDSKFYTKFEKNIKHKQQISLVSKYLKPSMKWLDAPIGSGRLMENVQHPRENLYGLDISDTFIELNRNRGIPCFKKDLLKMNMDERFDFITSLHTTFAFNDFRKILSNYIEILHEGGYLIVDIVNLHMYENFSVDNRSDDSVDVNGMKLEDIYSFFASQNCDVCEVINHDYFDCDKIIYWRNSGSRVTKKIKHLMWKILNIFYFKLNLFNLFDLFQAKKKITSYAKFLVVVRKK